MWHDILKKIIAMANKITGCPRLAGPMPNDIRTPRKGMQGDAGVAKKDDRPTPLGKRMSQIMAADTSSWLRGSRWIALQ